MPRLPAGYGNMRSGTMMKPELTRLISFIMAVMMLLSLAACGRSDADVDADAETEAADSSDQYPVDPNRTITTDSKWYNPSIDGAIDGTLEVSEKDDFYTAVNREWMLSTSVTKDNPYGSVSAFTDCMDLIKEQKLDILSGKVSCVSGIPELDS